MSMMKNAQQYDGQQPVVGMGGSAAWAADSHQGGNNEQNGCSTDPESDRELEKRICRNVIARLFSPALGNHMFNILYGLNRGDSIGPVFTDNSVQMSAPEPENAWCRLEVEDLKLSHFAKDPLPPFRICIRQLNGDPLPRSVMPDGTVKPMVDMRIRFTVCNKWADVTNEVLPDAQLEHTLVDGICVVPGLIFHEVSVKHGGHFILKISPLDFRGEVLSYKSPKLKIQSVKTHCLRKRKLHATAAMEAAKKLEVGSPDAPMVGSVLTSALPASTGVTNVVAPGIGV